MPSVPTPLSLARDTRFMAMAARLALRGHGGAEPNPLVGCVIVDRDDRVVGTGYHRRCGEGHAEIQALSPAGERARGATAYITLEPCNHTGRTGPCSDALIKAGVSRVVFARHDTGNASSGGAERLRAAGIEVDMLELPEAIAASEPFFHRQRTGRPWVVAKWAQTLDGRIATRTGASQWISSGASRRLVHRERGRVDAILTGIGTVVHDDPMLTARDVRVRRVARRVVVDPHLDVPIDSALVRTAGEAPTTIVCLTESAGSSRADALRERGVEILAEGEHDGRVCLRSALERLTERHEVSTVLTESGGGLLGQLFDDGLVNEALVFVAPKVLADEEAVPALRGRAPTELAEAVGMMLEDVRVRGGDVVMRYRVG